MEILSKQTNFDFLGKQGYFFVLSAILIAISFYFWFHLGTNKYGVDFQGGHEFVVQFSEDTHIDDIRAALSTGGTGDATIQAFGGANNQFSIRLNSPEEGTDADSSGRVKEELVKSLKERFQDKFQVIRTDFVGPTVGAELRKKALIAVSLGLLCMLLYVAFRFEFAFGVGAVVAVFHDVIVGMGIYLLCGHQINMATLAAALTIVGYSMNDTIVIFDRVREELGTHKGKESLSSLVNRCINITLSRTMITHFLTLLAVLSLYIFGGGELSDLSLFLLAGIVSGSYSTIYIASPVMIAWHKFRGGTEEV